MAFAKGIAIALAGFGVFGLLLALGDMLVGYTIYRAHVRQRMEELRYREPDE